MGGAPQTVTGTVIERDREGRKVRFRPAGRAAPSEPGPEQPTAEPESYVIPEDEFEAV